MRCRLRFKTRKTRFPPLMKRPLPPKTLPKMLLRGRPKTKRPRLRGKLRSQSKLTTKCSLTRSKPTRSDTNCDKCIFRKVEVPSSLREF